MDKLHLHRPEAASNRDDSRRGKHGSKQDFIPNGNGENGCLENGTDQNGTHHEPSGIQSEESLTSKDPHKWRKLARKVDMIMMISLGLLLSTALSVFIVVVSTDREEPVLDEFLI